MRGRTQWRGRRGLCVLSLQGLNLLRFRLWRFDWRPFDLPLFNLLPFRLIDR
jgi:hypothetical protein